MLALVVSHERHSIEFEQVLQDEAQGEQKLVDESMKKPSGQEAVHLELVKSRTLSEALNREELDWKHDVQEEREEARQVLQGGSHGNVIERPDVVWSMR